VHRDIKLENILVDSHFNLKLCDFTFSKTLEEGSSCGVFFERVGTERFMAPEILEGKPYKGTAADVFSLGVVIFILVTGVMPFSTSSSPDDELYQFIYKEDFKAYWEHLEKMFQGVNGYNPNVSD
jgi:serine/threonine protein kinase